MLLIFIQHFRKKRKKIPPTQEKDIRCSNPAAESPGNCSKGKLKWEGSGDTAHDEHTINHHNAHLNPQRD